MRHFSLPPGCRNHKLPFYLAMEEFAARNFDCDIFFMWQVDPTVIFGRNQMIECEVNLDYCRRNAIEVYRRKSGGGCVFADRSNIMFSYITTSPQVQLAFGDYCSRVTETLCALGLDAHHNSRNDIMIGSQKVSGSAFYRTGGRSIVHGTMLYDTDMTHMTNALTPSAEKLRTNGVKSVRSRVTTIVSHRPDVSLGDFKAHVLAHMTDGDPICPSDDDITEIEAISRPYYADSWIYGNNPRGKIIARRRIAGAGEFVVNGELRGGLLTDINLTGDFFITGDLEHDLIAPLRGKHFDRQSFEAALADCPPTENVIAGLDTAKFLDLIFES